MRRMPVIFLVDTSGRMQGERIEAVNKGIQTIIMQFMRQDPYMIETAYLSIATFNMQFTPLCELTGLMEFEAPQIDAIPSTPAMLGNAISCLADWLNPRLARTTVEQKGDWRGRIFLFWGGGIGDPQQLENATQKIGKLPVDILTIPMSTSNTNNLPESWATITDKNGEIDSNLVKSFFKWVGLAVNDSLHNSEPISQYLPPLPKEIFI